jgi:hypothetical protein
MQPELPFFRPRKCGCLDSPVNHIKNSVLINVRCVGCLGYGILGCNTITSKEYAASIFRVDPFLKLEAVCSSEMLSPTDKIKLFTMRRQCSESEVI